MTKAWILAAMMAALAAEAQAGGFGPVVGEGRAVAVSSGAPASTRGLELVRQILPREGREVVVPVAGGGTLATIEWRREVVVRARTGTGAPLSAGELAALRDRELRCGRGTPQGLTERTERSGTYEMRFDCTWLQGVRGQ